MKSLSLLICAIILAASQLDAAGNLENEILGSEAEILSAFKPQTPEINATEKPDKPAPLIAKSDSAEKVSDESKIEVSDESKMKVSHIDEAKIPVFKANSTPSKISESGWPKALITIGILGCLLFGTLLFLKVYKGKSKILLKESTIKIISQHHLGPRKSLVLVSVAGESMLVGVTDRQINLIKAVTLFEEEIEPQKSSEATFNKQLLKAQNVGLQDSETEDFQMSGLKDVLKERFRTLRKLS